VWNFKHKQRYARRWTWHGGDALCGATYRAFACGGDLAHSYSSRDLAHDSPNGFGATPGSLDDIAWAAGIEQRLAVADYTDRDAV